MYAPIYFAIGPLRCLQISLEIFPVSSYSWNIFFCYLSFRRRLREIFVALGEQLPRVLRINCVTSYTANDSWNKIKE